MNRPPYPLTLRLALAGFSAHSVGLSGVFYLPRTVADIRVGVPALRFAHHIDARLTLQASFRPGRWVELVQVESIEMVVE